MSTLLWMTLLVGGAALVIFVVLGFMVILGDQWWKR